MIRETKKAKKKKEADRAAEEAARAAEQAAREKQDKRFWRVTLPLIITAIVLVVGGFMWAVIAYESSWPDRMTADVGIVNGQPYDMMIADSLDSYQEVNGTIFFFAGSISTTNTSTLRMGYTSPTGIVRIIEVPIAKIEFQPNGESPQGSFTFRHWESGYPLQNNIDNSLEVVTVNLSLDELKQLINS